MLMAWVAVLVLLVASLIVDLTVIASGYYDYVGGGDCGGKSCVVHRADRGYSVAAVLGLVILVVAAPPLVRWRLRGRQSA